MNILRSGSAFLFRGYAVGCIIVARRQIGRWELEGAIKRIVQTWHTTLRQASLSVFIMEECFARPSRNRFRWLFSWSPHRRQVLWYSCLHQAGSSPACPGLQMKMKKLLQGSSLSFRSLWFSEESQARLFSATSDQAGSHGVVDMNHDPKIGVG